MKEREIAIDCNKEAGLRIWLQILAGEHDTIRSTDRIWWFQTQVRSVVKSESGQWVEYGEPWTKHMITNSPSWFKELINNKRYTLHNTYNTEQV